jgi:hypothetical protein
MWQKGDIFISLYSTRLGMDELLRLANSHRVRLN